MRGFSLRGEPRALARALDLLHVRADVRGVREEEDACEVWLAQGDAFEVLRDVAVRISPLQAPERIPTGRERDRVIPIAEDLIVRPPWVERPAGFSGLELVVPRGGAFGSGEHESTRTTLRLLHRLHPRGVRRFVDVGTGSGILALYAHLRGCPTVLACDLDPAAAAAARALVPAARVVLGGPAALDTRADVVVANLSWAELDAVLDDVLALWSGVGPLVLGGLRREEAARLRARIAAPLQATVEGEEFAALAYGVRAGRISPP